MENGKYREGASTLITRAKNEQDVLKRKGTPKINQKGKSWYDPDKPEGALIFKEVVEEYKDKKGKTKVRTQKSTQMAEVSDARKLSSGTPQEEAYAQYANKMKALANQARKELISTKDRTYSASAKATYQKEVDSLNAKLNLSLKNAPKERQAQLMANTIVSAKKKANPDMSKKEIKKASQQALTSSRTKIGAHRTKIDITPKEWDAIQSGAVSPSKLSQIIKYVDSDQLRQLATPRATSTLSTAKQNKIQAMKNSGYTNAEIAKALGVSASTVTKYS